MSQLSLKFAERATIDERFDAFLRLNPHVFAAFRDAAWRLRSRGHRRYSAKGIVEGLRFERSLETVRNDEYKINNDFTSRLARKLIAEEPGFAEFFEVRVIRSE